MLVDSSRQRQAGTIVSATFMGADKLRERRCCVQVAFKGGQQPFVCDTLDGLTKQFEHDLCCCFDAKLLGDIQGKKCYALRCWGGPDDPIEGLGSVDTGRIFTLTGWRRKQLKARGVTCPSPLEVARQRIRWDFERLTLDLANCFRDLVEMQDGYKEWSDQG